MFHPRSSWGPFLPVLSDRPGSSITTPPRFTIVIPARRPRPSPACFRGAASRLSGRPLDDVIDGLAFVAQPDVGTLDVNPAGPPRPDRRQPTGDHVPDRPFGKRHASRVRGHAHEELG